MKLNRLNVLGLVILAGVVSANAQTNGPADYSKIFKDDKEKNSYAVGMYYGDLVKTSLTRQGNSNDLDLSVLTGALQAAINGEPTRITEQQERDILTAYSLQLRAKQQEKQEAMQKAGTDFLAKNKNQPGVITLPNGLQYKILKAGTGDKPTADDVVSVDYSGTHVDGTVFDSGIHDFPVTRVIPGWTQALEMMPVGSKWRLFIPSELAYGVPGNPARRDWSERVADF